MVELKNSWKEYIEHFLKQYQEKYNLPKEVIEEIVTSQFRFTKSVMEDGKYYSVKLPRFGNFGISLGGIYNKLKEGKISTELAKEHLKKVKRYKKKPSKQLRYFMETLERQIRYMEDQQNNKEDVNKQ